MWDYAFNILYPNWDFNDVVEMSEQREIKSFILGYETALKDKENEETNS